MREVNPDATMIYIGEWYGGATASDLFFETANCIDDDSFDIATKNYFSFFGIHDHPYLIK